MKKAKFLRSPIRSFERNITHFEVSESEVHLKFRSSQETFQLERGIHTARCHLVNLFCRQERSFKSDPTLSTRRIEGEFAFTKTVLLGGAGLVQLVSVPFRLEPSSTPYFPPQSYVTPVLLGEFSRTTSFEPTESVLAAYRSSLIRGLDQLKADEPEPLPCLLVPAGSHTSENDISIQDSVFDSLFDSIQKYGQNLEAQAWLQFDGYSGVCGIDAIPAGRFQFMKIKRFDMGNLFPIKPTGTLPSLPADYMYRL